MKDIKSSEDLVNWYLNLPQPKPSLGVEAYQRERGLALAISTRRAENYRRYQQSGRKSKVDYLPIKLDIENVSRCNFRCIMCQISEWPREGRAEDLSLEDFKQLIDEQYGLVEIKLQGMGEPTLTQDLLFQMISYARARQLWVRTITNASLLHVNDNYKKMIDSRPNEIQISIDSARKETFESIRRGSNFTKVVSNCQLINNYADTKNTTLTKMWVVVQQANVNELSELVTLAHEMGFRSIVFSLQLTDWGQAKWRKKIGNDIAINNQITQQTAQDLIHQGEKYGVDVSFWTVTAKYSTSDIKTLCPWPFERAYISSDMRIVPCCVIANPEVLDLGDAHQFTQEWFGKNYQAFRQAHLEGDIPKACQLCYEGY